MTQALYLFCLANFTRLPAASLESLGGDDQTRLKVEVYQNLAAVWSPVELTEFSGPGAEERLQDLAWLGPRILRHQNVVARVMRHSPVMPVRFGTIFSSSDSLQEALRSHHDAIAGFLESSAGREEWAVKGMLDRAGARESLLARMLAREEESLRVLSPGKRYFAEQRRRAGIDRELQHWLQEVCRHLWTGLEGLATAVRKRRLQSQETTGSAREMNSNWAFLVPTAVLAAFQTLIRDANSRCEEQGLVFRCTGPWPPYSFCPALEAET